jgi:hypothetical protein
MLKKLISGMIAFIFMNTLNAEILTYRITTGDKVEYEKYTSITTDTGYKISSEFEEIIADRDFRQLRWNRKGTDDAHNPMDVTATRDGNRVLLTGSYKGKRIEKNYPINRYPWSQCAQFSLESFVRSGDASSRFWAISIHDLDIFEMEARNTGTETVRINGKNIETIRVRIGPTGFASAFWHADYWYRKTDFRYIRYEAVNGMPGTPPTIKELIEEKNE